MVRLILGTDSLTPKDALYEEVACRSGGCWAIALADRAVFPGQIFPQLTWRFARACHAAILASPLLMRQRRPPRRRRHTARQGYAGRGHEETATPGKAHRSKAVEVWKRLGVNVRRLVADRLRSQLPLASLSRTGL